MDYGKDILNRLVDIYERRGAYGKDASALRAIQMDVSKTYPVYADRYNHEAYRDINDAINKLADGGFVSAKVNHSGQFIKVKLNVDMVSECYKKLKRMSIPEQCHQVTQTLMQYQDKIMQYQGKIVQHQDNIMQYQDKMIQHQGKIMHYQNSNMLLLQNVLEHFQRQIEDCKKLPYDLGYDEKRISEVLMVLEAILKLEKETYIRNFSTALLRDSKRFQREFRSTIEGILFDYTDSVVEKDKILEFYNLYENPTYVFLKGDIQITVGTSVINVLEMPDGIALSNASLDRIDRIDVNAGKVVTVENLTTYHDSDEQDAVHIYLGGYHNSSKQQLLEKIYSDNKECRYFHKGDIDVYGFLILENLKAKTGIPFEALMMDVPTLERFYKAGIYKELTAHDVKIINAKKDTQLAMYADVLDFMVSNNCKVEQESIKAVELME